MAPVTPLPNADEPIAGDGGRSTPRWRAWLQRIDGLVQGIGADLGTYIANALLTTRGDIIVRDAAAPVRLPLGAPGTVLTAGATDPGWAAVAPASWTTVQGPTSVGTSTSYAVTGLATYKVLMVAIEGVSHDNASGRRLLLRFGVAGPTFRNTGYFASTGSVGGSSTLTTGIRLNENTVSSAQTVNGLLLIAGFGAAATKSALSGNGRDESPNFNFIYGRYDTAEAHDALQFTWDGSGNFDGGTVTIWGMR